MNEDRDHANEGDANGPPPLSEWIVAAIGLVLVASCIGYLGWYGLVAERTPPDPVVSVGAAQAIGGRWHVPLEIRNRGRETAAALAIQGELKQGERVVESADTELDYLPGESSREAGLYFTRDPSGLQLELRVRSYRKP